MKKRNYILLALVLLLVFTGCKKQVIKPESVLDTPENHYIMGVRALDKDNFQVAYDEFQRAIGINKKSQYGHLGMALYHGRKADFKNADKAIAKAVKLSKKAIPVEIVRARLITMKKGEEWLVETEKVFKKIFKKEPNNPEARFYMGMSYRDAFKFGSAAGQFQKVLEIKNNSWMDDADFQWKLMNDIQRAMPGTKYGKKIALMPKLDRSDFAVLLVEEFKLIEVIKKRRREVYDTTFKTPEQMAKKAAEKAGEPTDLTSHWAKNWVKEVLALDIRGLKPFPDGLFKPDMFMTRANFAQSIEDLIVLIDNDAAVTKKYIGETSHFPDVRSDYYAYNSIALVVDRGVLEVKSLKGEFLPEATISGAEALLAIRALQNALRLTF
ncbi:S-layer homology domain-containing protein [Candidatus Calescamantes bacterium]|nr:S-layer homology domain-containing protein [Candidatus Calescamantes bacterium]